MGDLGDEIEEMKELPGMVKEALDGILEKRDYRRWKNMEEEE